LPAARREALAKLTGVAKESEAVAVIVERGQDAYIGEVAKVGGDAARALVYVQQAFAEEPATPRVPAGDIAALSLMEKNAKITSTQAKTLLAELVANGGGDVIAMAKAKGFEAMDTGALESLVDQAIATDPDAWAKFKAGEQKAMGALVGAVMKLSKGKADGKAVTALLQAKANA
jgi:aspartyl-tRNA(Asn)/glutamyl-tRNA(Gln) amidotransferase subunit B